MPHFWMSYFQVESTEKTVELARKLNGIIEVDSTQFYNGKIALIRDPQGAGFTVYDGQNLYLSTDEIHGTAIKTELHVSRLDEVIPFYNALFNWNLTPSTLDTYQVDAASYNSKTLIRHIPNSVKGKYEYWVITFLVDNLEQTTHSIISNQGKLIMAENDRNMMSDNSGEAFFYIQEKEY